MAILSSGLSETERAMFTPNFSLSATRSQDPALETWRSRIGIASVLLTVLYFVGLSYLGT